MHGVSAMHYIFIKKVAEEDIQTQTLDRISTIHLIKIH